MSQISKVEVAGTTYDIAGSVNISATDSNKYNLIGTLESASGTTDTVYTSTGLNYDSSQRILEIGKEYQNDDNPTGLPTLRFVGSEENPDSEIGTVDIKITPREPDGIDCTPTFYLPYIDSGIRTFAVGSNAGVGSGSTPVYMKATGELTPCTNISSEDKNVYQENYTSSANLRVILSAAADDTSSTTTVKKSSKLTFNPSSAIMKITPGSYTSTGGSGAGYHVWDGTNYYVSLQAVKQGTASVGGEAKLTLGNNLSATTAGNAKGYIDWYSAAATYYQRLQPDTLTSNRTITVPDLSGEFVVHTNATAIGSGITPVYIAASGAATACSYPLIPYTTVTSW